MDRSDFPRQCNRRHALGGIAAIGSLALLAGCTGAMSGRAFDRLQDWQSGYARDWRRAQSRVAERALQGTRSRLKLAERLSQLADYRLPAARRPIGDAFYFLDQVGLDGGPTLFRSDQSDGNGSPVIGPGDLGTYDRILRFSPSPTGKHIAVFSSVGGSDEMVIHLIDVESGAVIPDVVTDIQHTLLAWHPDGKGFVYNDRLFANSMGEHVSRLRLQSVLPDDMSNEIVYEYRERDAYLLPASFQSETQMLIFRLRGAGGEPSRIDLDGRAPPLGIAGGALDPFGRQARSQPVGPGPGGLLLRTNIGAPRRRLVVANFQNPNPEKWRDLIAEGEDPLENVVRLPNHIAAVRQRHLAHRLVLHDLSGTSLGEIELPAQATVSGIRQNGAAIAAVTEGVLQPPTPGRIDLDEQRFVPGDRPNVDFPFADFESQTLFFAAPDGTPIPVLLTARRGRPFGPETPLWLHGYGGWRISMKSSFDPAVLAWLELGGAHAVAGLRGGTEYGEAWHWAGARERKTDVFGDFIAVAEGLISSGVTRPARLAIEGISNGGLLTLACALRKPTLFGAVVARMPGLDPLDLISDPNGPAAIFGREELGDPSDPGVRQRIKGYAPWSANLAGVKLPPVLLLAGGNDDRVPASSIARFAARLQADGDPGNQVLFKLVEGVGHIIPKQSRAWLSAWSDVLAFMWRYCGEKTYTESVNG